MSPPAQTFNIAASFDAVGFAGKFAIDSFEGMQSKVMPLPTGKLIDVIGAADAGQASSVAKNAYGCGRQICYCEFS